MKKENLAKIFCKNGDSIHAVEIFGNYTDIVLNNEVIVSVKSKTKRDEELYDAVLYNSKGIWDEFTLRIERELRRFYKNTKWKATNLTLKELISFINEVSKF